MIFGIAFFGNILGTFIIRAGFLNSVHSFVNDDNKTFFLISLLMNLFIFLVIFSQQNYKKEATFIKKKLDIQINNIFFCLVLILIILGTFLPIFFSFDSIIKPSYFNNLLIPLCFIFT
jgi:cytochrome c-type biogenesis protein CcmF